MSLHLFAQSDGWAAEVESEVASGSRLHWAGKEWEVVGCARLPCGCDPWVAFVRAVGSGLTEWQGISCKHCNSGVSWTIEAGTFGLREDLPKR